MTLRELCEPYFQHVCRVTRSVRRKIEADPAVVRAELKALLADATARAQGTPGLARQFQQVEPALLFFADQTMREAGGRLGAEWKDLAAERGYLGGEERFFDLLDECLKDRADEAVERLEIFYTCLGLGFTGWLAGQPEALRKKMLELSARLRGRLSSDDAARICPEAYEGVDTSDLIEPPGRSLVGIAIALVGLVIVLFVANVVLYRQSASELTSALRRIIDSAEAPGAGG